MNHNQHIILLVNMGSPYEPMKKEIKRYLTEFLNDPRVIDIPGFFRYLLVNYLIIPFRYRKTLRMYQEIWTEYGAPQISKTEIVKEKLQDFLDSKKNGLYHVEIAMRYREPSLKRLFEKFSDNGIRQVTVLPLFPLYASATVGSIYEKIFSLTGRKVNIPALRILPPFYDHPDFIKAMAAKIEATFKQQKKRIEDFIILFSFHGLPMRQIYKADRYRIHCMQSEDCCSHYRDHNSFCYRAQCFDTAGRIASQLKLADKQWLVAFQSRLGRGEWLKPYTHDAIGDIASTGHPLAIAAPCFVVDNLETLEELNRQERSHYLENGGREFVWIPSLNEDPLWIKAMAAMITRGLE